MLRAHHIFLAFSLQIFIVGAALAWSPDHDREPTFGDSRHCDWYDLIPAQSQESQEESEEEEEPDCD